MADILIVEDETAINELIRRNLELVGHRCVDSYDHAEQRATSKILMSGFHIFIASIKDSKHCCQCTK